MAMARSLLRAHSKPAMFSGEAVMKTVRLLNCASMKSIDGMTPYEAWHHCKLVVHYLCTFECVAHVKTMKVYYKKFED
jgi:hypothetical protein